jgi:branched-chain amino acid transport system permease protein
MEDLLGYLHVVVLPQVIDALIIGVALALVALGLTMIFGLLDVINLAHGDLYMLGGYAAFTLLGWGAGYWGALVLVPILVGLVGWGLEELGIRPLLPRADRAIVTLLLTFGVSLVLRDIAQVVWGTQTHAVAPPFTGIVSFAEVFVPTYRLFVFGIALFPRSRDRRNPRQRRLLRSDHVRRRGNLVQDRAQYESNRRFRRSHRNSGPAHRTPAGRHDRP